MARRYGLQIRAATSADAAAIAELMGAGGSPVPSRLMEARLDAFRQQPGIALLAEEWGPPTGVIALTWARLWTADQPVARIEILLVSPEERRRGLGRLLLKAGAQAARSAGCGQLQLLVPAGDASLREFGEANGFGEAGAIRSRPLRKG